MRRWALTTPPHTVVRCRYGSWRNGSSLPCPIALSLKLSVTCDECYVSVGMMVTASEGVWLEWRCQKGFYSPIDLRPATYQMAVPADLHFYAYHFTMAVL